MSTHKWIDRICAGALALALVLTVLFMNGEALGIEAVDRLIGYENRIFDNSRVHTLDIVIDDWDSFVATAQSEVYEMCSVVIDGEKFSNVALRAKGNTSLMNVSAAGSQRYSFKIEFDHYDSTKSYHGLDKLCLNNLIQDNTMMKDYLAYTMMAEFDAATPLCSFVFVTVNGEDFGLYLAVEAVEDSFALRNYGSNDGVIYKPDTLNMGGGDDGADAGGDAGGSVGGEATGGDTDSSGGGETTEDPAATAPAGDTGSAGSEDGETATIPADAEATQSADSEGGEGSQGGETAATEPTGEVPAGDTGSAGSEEGETPTTPTDTEAAQPADSEGGEGSQGGETGATEPNGEATADDGNAPGGSGGGENAGGENPGFDMGGGMFGMGGSGATLQYVDDNLSSYSSIFSSAKTDITEEDQLRLVEALKILNTGSADSVDVDRVIRYFVVHNYVVNGDSYTGSIIHNYYLYEEDGILSMIPWDYNLGYGTFQGNDANSTVNDDIDRPLSTSGNDRPMLDWILDSEEYTELYHTYFQEFLDTVDPVAIIEAAYELIAPYVEKDPTRFCTYEEFEIGVEAMKAFCKLRTQSVRLQLSGSDATVDASGLKISDLGVMGGDTPGDGGDSSGGGEENNTGNENTGDNASSGGGEGTPGGEVIDGTTPTMPTDGTTPTAPAEGQAPTGEEGSAGSEGGEVTDGTTPTAPAEGQAPTGEEGSAGSEGGEVTDGTTPTMPADGTTPTAPAGGQAPTGSEGGEGTTPTAPAEGQTPGGENPFGGMTPSAGTENPTGGQFPSRDQTGTGTVDSQWIELGICGLLLAAVLLFAFLFKRKQ